MTKWYVDGKYRENAEVISLANALGVRAMAGVRIGIKGAVELLRRGGYHVSGKPCAFNHPDEPCSETCGAGEARP